MRDRGGARGPCGRRREIDAGCRETARASSLNEKYSAVSAAPVAVEKIQRDRRKLQGSQGKGKGAFCSFVFVTCAARLEL